jgi:filamentous hemagglutinin family protein
MKNNKLRMAILAALYSGGAAGQQIQFDGFDGAGNGNDVVLNPTANIFTIAASEGRLSANGASLFHSFLRFSVPDDHTALFAGNANTGAVTNIIARVSGGEVSAIDGIVRSGIANAGFWLVNPAGIVVGADGAFDVGGTLALGAADAVNFWNGTQWLATGDGAAASTFAVSPAAFGFLGTSAGQLSISDLTHVVAMGGSALFSGGSGVSFDNVVLDMGGVATSGFNAPINIFANHGDVVISDSIIDNAGTGGSIGVSGRGVRIDNSYFTAETSRDPSVIFVGARNGDLVVNTSSFFVDGSANANRAGTIEFNAAGDIALGASSFLSSQVTSTGTPCTGLCENGGINLNAVGDISAIDSFLVTNLNVATENGQRASEVNIRGETVWINGGAIVAYSTRPGATPQPPGAITNTGQIRIFANGSDTTDRAALLIDGGSQITSNASTAGFNRSYHNAAGMTLEALNGTIRVAAATGATTALESNAAEYAGHGGTIEMDARDIEIENARISTVTRWGDEISGTGSISLDAEGSLSVVNATIASGLAHGTGSSAAGSIELLADEIDITGASVVRAISRGWQSADGGNITIHGENRLTVQGGSTPTTFAQIVADSGESYGDAGDISMTTSGFLDIGDASIQNTASDAGNSGELLLQGAGVRIADSFASTMFRTGVVEGDAGTIVVRATGVSTSSDIDLADPGSAESGVVRIVRSRFQADNQSGTNSASDADLAVEGDWVVLDGGRLTANLYDGGTGDDISVRGDIGVRIIGSSEIKAETDTFSPLGGNIEIEGGVAGILVRQSTISTRTFADFPHPEEGDFSNITLTSGTGLIELDRATVSTETVVTADAGDIAITGDRVAISGSTISAAMNRQNVGGAIADAGDITITATSTASNAETAALVIGGNTVIRSSVENAEGVGLDYSDAGNITIDSYDDLEIGAAEIRTSVDQHGGHAGSILVRAADNIRVSTGAQFRTETASQIDLRRPATITFDATGGDVTVNGALLEASTTGVADAGSISIKGGEINFADSDLFARSTSSGSAGQIEIEARGNVGLVSGTVLETSAAGSNAGGAGRIFIDGGLITIDGSTARSSSQEGESAGDIEIEGAGVLITNQSHIEANYNSGASGGPGSIIVSVASGSAESAPQTDLANVTTGVIRIVESGLSANNQGGREAAARGDISLNGGQVVIAGSRISTDVENNGLGDDIAIEGRRGVWIIDTPAGGYRGTQQRPYSSTGTLISATTGRNAGAGGDIAITSANGGITIERSVVDTTSHANNNISPGNIPSASLITITANNGHVSLEGATVKTVTTGIVDAGDINISAQSFSASGGLITAATTGDMVTDDDLRGAGDAGNVTITTTGVNSDGAALRISSDATISSDANDAVGREVDGTEWAPNAGTVVIAAQNGSVDISGSAVSTGAGALAGDAGIVRVRAGVDATIRDSSTIDTTVRARRYGAPAIISVDGQQSVHISSSVLAATTEGDTYAGDVLVSAPTVVLDGAQLRASSDREATGSAGAISVQGNSLLIASSVLSTSTTTTADAGIVIVTARGAGADALSITGASTIESRADGGRVGTGGNTSIADAGTIRLISENGGIMISGGTNAAERTTITTSVGNAGSAGSISFNADSVLIRNATVTTSVDSMRLEGDHGDLEAAEITIQSDGTIALESASLLAETTGLVAAGEISLTGSAVSVTGGGISASSTNAGDAGSIALTAGGAGAVTLRGGAVISTSSDSLTGGAAGAISITAGSVSTDNATISTSIDSLTNHQTIAQILIDSAGATSLGNLTLRADTSGATTAGSITIESDGALTANGGTWTAETTGAMVTAGNGGSLAVRGAGVGINGVNIRASTSGQGDAGSIAITSSGAVSANGGGWVAETTGTAAGSGAGGSISLTGNSVALTNLDLTASTAGPGAAGSVNVASPGAVSVTGGDWTAATTGTAVGSGNGGSFDIEGASVTLNGVQMVASSAGRGHAGNIDIVANGVAAETVSIGTGTNLRSEALDASVAGNAGSITVDARNGGVSMTGAVLRTSAGATAGHAGTIDILAERNVRLTNTAATTTVASALAPQPAEINVHAGGTVEFLNADLSANTSGAAAAGSIDVTGTAILISEGSSLSSNSTGGSGAAGSICVYTSGLTCPAPAISQIGGVMALAAPIPATGGITIEDSTLSTLTTGSGNAGSIHVLATGPVTFMNGDVISESRSTTSSSGSTPGVSGSINIDVGANSQLAFLNGSLISTEALAADGGSITVNAANSSVEISDSRIEASAGGGVNSNGGNVILNDFGDTIMRRSFIFARAQAGNGGRIDVLPEDRTGLFLRDTESAINADSDAGNDGEVNISSPDTDIDSAIQKQDAELNAAPVLVASTCDAAKSDRSTLVREARGAVTESPDGYLGAAVEVPATRTTQNGADDSPRLAVNMPAASTTGGCL